MKVRVKVQPSGLLSIGGQVGVPWPEVGETFDLPDSIAEGMIANGHLEVVKPPKKTEPKAAKKAEPKVEKAVASKANVETRKK